MDRLPPHSEEAERGVLGCILLAPEVLAKVRERCGNDAVFYHLAHRDLFEVMCGMADAGKPIDLLTLHERLKSAGKLEQVGGLGYVSGLPDQVPTAANFEHYLGIVWEKFLAREVVRGAAATVSEVYERNGVTEALWGRLGREHQELEAKCRRGTGTAPQYLKQPVEFAEEVYAKFLGEAGADEPGLDLPFGFPMKVRRGEFTLVSGDDGCGKSTLLNYVAVHLMGQGEKVGVASFEMRPGLTLWMMGSQLLGCRRLPDTEEGRRTVTGALGWLQPRVWFYSFLGIGDYRDVLDTFRYAAERLGVGVVIVDSAMRLGIPDDDYGLQGQVAAQMAQMAQSLGVHVFLVIHENKSSEARGKKRIRGSALWTANVDNILGVEINRAKLEKVARLEGDLEMERGLKRPDGGAIEGLEKELGELRKKWDTALYLRKQRLPGSRQNASRYLYFDTGCFQFRGRWEEETTNWLEKWKNHE